MPAPGDLRPASLTVTLADPSAAHLFAPFGRLRDRLADYADRMQILPIRSTLAVMFVALLVFLAVIAGLQQ